MTQWREQPYELNELVDWVNLAAPQQPPPAPKHLNQKANRKREMRQQAHRADLAAVAAQTAEEHA